MTTTKTGKAFAKINLSLDIKSKMDDGYHYLQTIMQTVGLCDEITVNCKKHEAPSHPAPHEHNRIIVNAGSPFVPNNEQNIAAKAAATFLKHTGITGYQIKIRIIKKIPVCAGLGGGSADAACVLRILDEMFETALGRENLEKLAYEIGADVPFCVDGGTKLAEGRGEILTDLPPMPHSRIVICKPQFFYSTQELFGRIRCKNIHVRPNTDDLISAIKHGGIGDVARRMYNVFEDFLPRGKREIDSIKGTLLEHGALGASMTGSGPTVFGLFDNSVFAENAYKALSENYEEVYITEAKGEVL